MPTPTPPESLSDVALESSITRLAAHIHAATFRLLRLLAEFDRRRTWAEPGMRSCAHWMNWKCGIALGPAREKLRVAHALPALPDVSAAFERGELSYSKVRAITRIATPQNESRLLNVAHHGTAAHLERLVRGYRRAVAAGETAAAERVHRDRYLRWRWDDDGALLIEARLDPDAGARVLAALEAVVTADEERAGDSWLKPLPQKSAHPGTEVGDPMPPCNPSVGDPMPPCNPPWERLQPRTVRPGQPAVGAASAANNPAPPSPIDTPIHVSAETRMAAARQRNAERPARRADALARLIECGHGALVAEPEIRANPSEIVVHVDAATLANRTSPPDTARCHLEHGPHLAPETARRLACDGAIASLVENATGEPVSIGRRTRAVPAPMRRALHARDRGCRFPGCTATHRVEAHHIRHWAAGGETSVGNLAELCPLHHRLVHEGGYGVEHRGDNRLHFTRPDGQPIPDCPRPAALRPAEVLPALAAATRSAGHAIDHRTCVPNWDGGAMDTAMAVDGLLWVDGKLKI